MKKDVRVIQGSSTDAKFTNILLETLKFLKVSYIVLTASCHRNDDKLRGFNAYLCKQYFRLNSEKTGRGGYEKSASQEVVVSDEVLVETGRRNIFVTNKWIR